ncbi:MAG TPA: TIGR03790 family protein [Kiritimatiellia bacterium]|nr:TIGR03790 family protein [Kiritimatiellia bacterium]
MRRLVLGGCFAVAVAWTALGGGGPLHTLVVVNDASPDSLDIGLRYARARGIPESHLCHVATATTGTILIAAWSNEIRNPVLNFIEASGLSNQIDYVVFAQDFPFRVWRTNSPAFPPGVSNWTVAALTACMFYDFFASSNAFQFGCQLHPLATNAYFSRERAFSRAASPNGRQLISSLLTGRLPDDTRRTLGRAALADGSSPSGRIDLVRTSDGLRSARWPLHEEADFRMRLQGAVNHWVLRTFDPIPVSTNRMGYQTGRDVVPDVFAHQYLPGAYADHLTSYGGILDQTEQMRVYDWLRAGAAGSYGTVVEPCVFLEKFPQPMLYARYERGFSLGEAIYQSVSHPYQGLVVGDPLTAPYARPSVLAFDGMTNGMAVSGVITISVAVAAADATRPVHRIDFFAGGRWSHTAAALGPVPGNEYEIVLPDAVARYEAAPGDELFACAEGLAAAVNATSSLASAVARGDSVELTWLAYGESAAAQPIGAATLQGTGSVLHAYAWSARTNFLDPVYAAHEILRLTGTATTGDQLIAVLTLTNGVVVTNSATAATSMTAWLFLTQLQGVINSNAALQGADGVAAVYSQFRNVFATQADLVLAARTVGFDGLGLHVDYSILPQPGSTLSTNDAFADFFNDNASTMRPRALVRLAEGVTNLPAAWTLDTTTLPNGPLRIDAVAFEGTAVRAQGRARLDLVVSNSPFRCMLTAPPAWHHVMRGGTVTSAAEVADAVGVVTQVAFFVEGKLAGTTGAPPYTFVWATTNRAIGAISVQARADTDAGAAALSAARTVVIYTDDDADGLSDQWEYDWFGSATNAVGTDDPDGDGVDNRGEFLADTDPTDPASFLRVETLAGTPVDITFPARTTRVYRIGYLDDTLDGSWASASGTVMDVEGAASWADVPSNAPPAPGSLRAYRVETGLP